MSYRASAEPASPRAEDEPPPTSSPRRSKLRVASGPAEADDSVGSIPQRLLLTAPPGPALDFDELYDAWFEDVHRWVRALGAPAGDREDLVQDVFLVAYRRLPDFDGCNPAGWLYRIARRRVRDYRRLRWFKHLVQGRSALPESMAHAAATPSERLEQKQTGHLLERLLDSLNPEQRVAFVLFEVEGYSGQEIATLQAVPINTVWARIHTARKKLKQRLDRPEQTRSTPPPSSEEDKEP